MNNDGKLRISGADGGAWRLGEPMLVHEGQACIGRIDPVPVSPDGTEVHVEHLDLVAGSAELRSGLSTLMLLEVTAHIVEHCTTVQAISFALDRQLEGRGDSTKIAIARSLLLQRIGASHVVVRPKPDTERAGQFVVTGLWEYTPASLSAFQAVLQAERASYQPPEAGGASAHPHHGQGLAARLKRMLARVLGR